MRITTLAALALLCLVPLTSAHAAGHNRGATCPQAVPCDGTAGWSADNFKQAATQCLSSYLGYSNEGDLFDNAVPDSSGCLSTSSNIKGSGDAKVTIIPHCCVVPTSANSCNMRCELINTAQ